MHIGTSCARDDQETAIVERYERYALDMYGM